MRAAEIALVTKFEDGFLVQSKGHLRFAASTNGMLELVREASESPEKPDAEIEAQRAELRKMMEGT